MLVTDPGFARVGNAQTFACLDTHSIAP